MSTKSKAKLPIILLLLVIVGGAAVVFGPKLLKSGGMAALKGLDEWLARQMVAISSTYIVPKIEFKKFEYDPPYTVRMTGVTLTAPDGTKVVEAGTMIVTLAETPGLNKPVVIQNVELDDATLRLIATPEGGFKGLVPFMKGENIKDQSKVDENAKLSNVFQLRKVTLKNGGLVYDAGDGSAPMNLTGLNLETGVEPAGEPGWYKLAIASARPPEMDLKIDGRLNIDTFEADFADLVLKTRLDAGGDSSLPPQLSDLLKQHEVKGEAEVRVTGLVPLRDWKNGNFRAALTTQGLNVAAGDYRLPIEQLDIEAALAGGMLTVTKGQVNLCKGNITLSDTSVNVAQSTMPGRATWSVRDFELRELLRIAAAPGETPKMAGRTATDGSVTFNASDALASINGSGPLNGRDGRLVALPIIAELMEAMSLIGQLTGNYDLSDKADAEFTLQPNGLNLNKSSIETQVVLARISGVIAYDGTLDLEANAGPMEKVQGMLGKVGDLIGKATDQLVKYKVTGKAGNPQVSVRPLGL